MCIMRFANQFPIVSQQVIKAIRPVLYVHVHIVPLMYESSQSVLVCTQPYIFRVSLDHVKMTQECIWDYNKGWPCEQKKKVRAFTSPFILLITFRFYLPGAWMLADMCNRRFPLNLKNEVN